MFRQVRITPVGGVNHIDHGSTSLLLLYPGFVTRCDPLSPQACNFPAYFCIFICCHNDYYGICWLPEFQCFYPAYKRIHSVAKRHLNAMRLFPIF